jgi:hypothetical protein
VHKLITIYWRDIPAQVIGRKGRKSVFKQALHPRFERAIDRAAMRAGRGSSDAYLSDWRRSTQTCEADLAAAVAAEVLRLERVFPPDVLERVIRAGGLTHEASG